jgi:ABC-type branched-subunit amino acid transport system substrate-binding protein
MQPASSASPGNEGAGSSGALKKWGPIAVIVVLIVGVITVIATSGGSDDEQSSLPSTPVESTSSTPGNDTGDGSWAYPLSFPQAEELGVVDTIDWGDRCDVERGRLAVVDYFAPFCMAPFSGDNGGATSTGVTANTITIVQYQGPENDPIINYITDAVKVDDTNAQEFDTVANLIPYFERFYEFYGRSIEIVRYESTGLANDEVTARADAQRIAEEYKPFAVVGGPALTNAFADELAAREVVCISCGSGSASWFAERDPYVWGIDGNAAQKQVHVAEFIGKQLVGKPAIHAGDQFTDTIRKFGYVYVEGSSESKVLADQMVARLDAVGAKPAEVLPYVLDPGSLQQTASQIIAKLKAAGVTTVILSTDPVAPRDFTREATAQEYFPEWLVAAATLTDTTAFGRSYDQQQWAHAFGVTSLAVRVNPEISGIYSVYKWFTGQEPPADESIGVFMPGFQLLFSGLQSTGPNLNPANFAAAIRSFETVKAISQPWLTWGEQGIWDEMDYNGIDDATLFWWDAQAEGADENRKMGTGLLVFPDGGKRYLPGEWGTEDRLFDPEGAIGIYDTPPPGEEPINYPSPVG